MARMWSTRLAGGLYYLGLRPLRISINEGGRWFAFTWWPGSLLYVALRIPLVGWLRYCRSNGRWHVERQGWRESVGRVVLESR
nr:MAG: hypothetical protein DIU58_18080 [Sphaerobacter thermophilus]